LNEHILNDTFEQLRNLNEQNKCTFEQTNKFTFERTNNAYLNERTFEITNLKQHI